MRGIALLRYSDLRGATSFRLALLFAGLFGTASLAFASWIYFLSSHFLSGNPDERMRAEAEAFGSRPKQEALRLLDQHSVDDLTGRRPFGLFESSGKYIGGNLRQLPVPLPEPETFFETRVVTDKENTTYRSILHRLPNGNLVVVSRNVESLVRFRTELLGATILSAILMLLLGIGGGVLIGIGSLRRLDKVTEAIERITSGDLSGRLPSRGSGDDLDRLVHVVNAMLDQIERLMGEVKGVCDSIAHDLRTPLTRLLAGLERANRRNLSDSDRRAAIEMAISEAKGALKTFAALLRISEIEHGVRYAVFAEVDLVQIVSDACEHFEPLAEAKSIDLSLHIASGEGGQPALEGDADLLFEAIANLLDNAIKFTPVGGTIRVEVGAGPCITVTDSGRGIAPADRGIVILRFRRGSSSRDTPGNGLGLPLVVAIAQLHGLALRIEDGNPGARFVLDAAA